MDMKGLKELEDRYRLKKYEYDNDKEKIDKIIDETREEFEESLENNSFAWAKICLKKIKSLIKRKELLK